MKSKLMTAGSFVCGAGLVLGLVFTLGLGPIDPPPGPVESTGRTLDEIYDRIGEIEAGILGDAGPWNALVTVDSGGPPAQILQGSGVVHAVILRPGRGIKLSTNEKSGALTIADLFVAVGMPSQTFVLNVRYNNGLILAEESGLSSDRCTILYRPDAM